MNRNKSVEDFLISDWMNAYTNLNKNSFNNLKKIAQKSGIEVPAFVSGNSKPVVRFQFSQDGLTDRHQRVQQTERVTKFKKDINSWAVKVEAHLKSNILMKKRKYKKHDGKTLADSLAHKIHLDRYYGVEPKSVGFKFERHGIYWAKGAYRGHAGYIGSKWTDRYGRLKTTSSSSIGMIGEGNRKYVDWFNPIIDDHIEELQNIAVQYCGDMTLDLTRIHIQ